MLDTGLINQLCPKLRIYGNMILENENNKAINLDKILQVNGVRSNSYIRIWLYGVENHYVDFIKKEHCSLDKFLEILEIYHNEKLRRRSESN